MKLFFPKARGWTLIEVLLLIALLAIVVALIPCAPGGARKRAQRVACASNLKQIAHAQWTFAADHDGRFSFACPTNAGGSLEWTNHADVSRHFAVLSNDLMQPARVLTCPADGERPPGADFASLKSANLSYCIGFDGATNAPEVFLAGDRNISGGKQVTANLIILRSNSTVTWTKTIHVNAGNVALARGDVLQLTSPALQQQLAAMTNEEVRIALP